MVKLPFLPHPTGNTKDREHSHHTHCNDTREGAGASRRAREGALPQALAGVGSGEIAPPPGIRQAHRSIFTPPSSLLVSYGIPNKKI